MKGKFIDFEVTGPYALFSIPLTSMSGNKVSYPVPTYSALKGILENVYWKPTIKYHIISVRVMNQIQNETITVNNIKETKTSSVYAKCNSNIGNLIKTSIPTPIVYLKNVRYQVRAYFEFDMDRPDLAGDRDAGKHGTLLDKALKRGGRFNVTLGSSECPATVRPCVYGEGEGFYDNYPELNIGLMLHSLVYENKIRKAVRYFSPIMNKGIIDFCKPEECTIIGEVTRK